MKLGFLAGTVFAMVFSFALTGHAHKGVTSKYTYNEDVYPIFLARCGHCHVAGGVGPMSLLTYDEAFPWAESLRAELLETEGVTADRAASFIGVAHRDVSARDLDVILDWATGGTPQGDPQKMPPRVALSNEWTHGPPNLTIPLPSTYQMTADTSETTETFVLPLSLETAPLVNAVDVRPDTPAIVREVTVRVRANDGSTHDLGIWTPKQNPAPIMITPPVRLSSGSEILVRIHYKKTWKYEGQPMTDRSAVGLYFAP
jgi:hypothetical protein